MGIPTNDMDLSGPFTKEEAGYISGRKRLREELRAAGDLHLLEESNWVTDDEFDIVPEPQPDFPPTAPQSQPPKRDDDPVVDEVYEEVDRDEWSQAQLQTEINQRNKAIEEFNEGHPDEEDYEFLNVKGSKAVLREVLTTHDKEIWDLHHTEEEDGE